MRTILDYLLIAVLILLAGASTIAEEDFCKEYKYGAEVLPSDVPGMVQKAFAVEHAFPVGDVVVPLTIWHPRLEDLRISLTAEAEKVPDSKNRFMKRVILKDVGQAFGNNMSLVFTDMAGRRIQSIENMSGAVRPVQKLSFLYQTSGRPSVVAAKGGSQGTWTISVEDTAADQSKRKDAIFDWSLILCQMQTQYPVGSIPMTNSPSGAMVSDAVQAFAGKSQPMAWTVNSGGKGIDFANNFDSYLESMNEGCNSQDECQDKKNRLWRSAAALMYLGMKEHGQSDETALNRLSEFIDKAANKTIWTDKDRKIKLGGSLSSLFDDAKQTLSNGLSGALNAVGNALADLGFGQVISNQKPDKIIWSRALDIPGITENIKSAQDELSRSLGSWNPGSKVKSMLQNGKSFPDFGDISNALSDVASTISEKSQSWMESRSEERQRFFGAMEAKLGDAQNKLESRVAGLSDWKPKIPDLSGVKNKIEDSRNQLKSRLQSLEGPSSKIKEKVGTAVENTVRKELEAASGSTLENIAQLMNSSALNTSDFARSMQNLDLSSLVPKGLDLNFKHGLSLDGPLGEELVGQLLGIDDPEETKALMQGLKEAGFQDLMKEFLNPALL